MLAVLRAQAVGLAAVFGDLVGLLLPELRLHVGGGPGCLGALLRFMFRLHRLLFGLAVDLALLAGLLPIESLRVFRLAVEFAFGGVGLALLERLPLLLFARFFVALLEGLALLVVTLGGLLRFGAFLQPGLLLLFNPIGRLRRFLFQTVGAGVRHAPPGCCPFAFGHGRGPKNGRA